MDCRPVGLRSAMKTLMPLETSMEVTARPMPLAPPGMELVLDLLGLVWDRTYLLRMLFRLDETC